MRSLHIKKAHSLWKGIVQPADTVIDATCGNGHDSLILSTLVPEGTLYVFDIQKEALEKTKEKLTHTHYIPIHGSHAQFPPEIQKGSVRLIVYNLGYLPGGDKSITTLTESTLESIQNALPLLTPDGILSITLYPGHPEGFCESQAVLEFAKGFRFNHYTFKENLLSPSLLIIFPMHSV